MMTFIFFFITFIRNIYVFITDNIVLNFQNLAPSKVQIEFSFLPKTIFNVRKQSYFLAIQSVFRHKKIIYIIHQYKINTHTRNYDEKR